MTNTVTINPAYWAELNALGRRMARFHYRTLRGFLDREEARDSLRDILLGVYWASEWTDNK